MTTRTMPKAVWRYAAAFVAGVLVGAVLFGRACPYERVLARTKAIEASLTRLGGRGNGLWEKAESLGADFHGIKDEIAYVAHERNALVHDQAKTDVEDMGRFRTCCDAVDSRLAEIAAKRRRR